MYGWRLQLDPSLDTKAIERGRFEWMQQSASRGFGEAMFKVSRNLLSMGKMEEAETLLRGAVKAGESDASYQLLHLILLGVLSPTSNNDEAVAAECLDLLKHAASTGSSPYGGTVFAMYNLGIAYLYGFLGLTYNPQLAIDWFKASRLPEGYMMLSVYYNSTGHKEEGLKWQERALLMGFGSEERVKQRDKGGFGLHNIWPGVSNDKGPPRW